MKSNAVEKSLKCVITQLFFIILNTGPFSITDPPVSEFVWNFKTQGMTAVGQDELAILLVKKVDEETPPRDIFEHLQSLYEQAGRGGHISGNFFFSFCYLLIQKLFINFAFRHGIFSHFVWFAISWKY